MLTPKQDMLVANWRKAQEALQQAKEIEMQLRAQVAAEVFNYNENDLKKGTENIELGRGWKLKGEFKLNHSLSKEDGAVEKALEKLMKAGQDGAFVAARLVKFEPKLSVSEYNKLTDKQKAIIDTVVTVKSSAPTITLVAPKA